MVNAARVALAWITVIVVFLVILMLYVVLSPQVEIWAEVLANFTGMTYSSALRWTDLSWKVVPIIIEGGVIVWAVISSFSEEFQSDMGDLGGGY